MPAPTDLPATSGPAETPLAAARPGFLERAGEILRRPLVALLLVVAAVFAAYRPALDADFLWDDIALVRENFLIRSPLFVLEVFRHTLFGGVSNFYRPTQTVLFIADYWMGGLHPYVFHFSSILLHALNGVVLFLLLRRLLPALLPLPASDDASRVRTVDLLAWLLALVWALYPVHSATVAYIAGSADSLATLFCILAWLAAEHFQNARRVAGRIGWGLAAGFCLLGGLCAKEIAFVWLVLFALYSFVFSHGARAGLRPKLTLMAGSMAVFAVYLVLRHLPPPFPEPPAGQHFPRIQMALRALGDYGSLLLFPARLLMERQVYPAPGAVLTAEDRFFYGSLTVGGVLVLAVFLSGAFWKGSGQRLRVFGVCWFMCGFLPVSNLFVRINASVAEHWLYLPSIGFLLFAAGCVWQAPTLRLRRAAAVLAVVAACAFGVRTWYRAFDWMNEMTFFRQTVAAGGDVPRARMGEANALIRSRHDDEAIELLKQVMAAQPGNVAAKVNLANAYGRLGRLDEARAAFRSALVQVDSTDARTLLVIVKNLDRFEQGRPEWAELRAKALAAERKRYPDSWELTQFSVSEAVEAGHTASAVSEVSAYAKAHWWHYPSWYTLGCLYGETGQSALGVATLRQASRLDVHDPESLSVAARISAGAGDSDQAIHLQQEAVDRAPNSMRMKSLLAQLIEQVHARKQSGAVSASATLKGTIAAVRAN